VTATILVAAKPAKSATAAPSISGRRSRVTIKPPTTERCAQARNRLADEQEDELLFPQWVHDVPRAPTVPDVQWLRPGRQVASRSHVALI
jgi:hypothetical protein